MCHTVHDVFSTALNMTAARVSAFTDYCPTPESPPGRRRIFALIIMQSN